MRIQVVLQLSGGGVRVDRVCGANDQERRAAGVSVDLASRSDAPGPTQSFLVLYDFGSLVFRGPRGVNASGGQYRRSGSFVYNPSNAEMVIFTDIARPPLLRIHGTLPQAAPLCQKAPN